MSGLQIGEDHPLSLELASLKATVARYQHEAHSASVKLQRHSLDTSHALEQTHALQQENARLREEIVVLKAHPDVTPHPATLQVPELSLALRRLSEKLTFTEETLLERTTELTHSRSDLQTAQSDAEAAHALTVQAYIQIDHERQRERELERRVRAAEEDRRLADLVVQEYADLVRTLEGRNAKTPPSPFSPPVPGSATDSSTALINGLTEGKLGLQRLLGEHNIETEKLATHITKLSDENELLQTQLDVERKRSEADRESLAKVLLELDKHRIDDTTATKMVSRYMKFSQSTIDSLQQAMENMKTRHTATLATLNAQAEYLQKALSAERRQAEKLRTTLDELSEDINREAYGRRREVALRLAFLSREESLAENLRRWLRRSKESMDRSPPEPTEPESKIRDVFDHVLRDGESLLESLNGQAGIDDNAPASVARLVAAQDAVRSITKELHAETERRLHLQRELAEFGFELPASADGVQAFTLSALPPRNVSLGRVSKENGTAAPVISISPDIETPEVVVSGTSPTSAEPPIQIDISSTPSPYALPVSSEQPSTAATETPYTSAPIPIIHSSHSSFRTSSSESQGEPGTKAVEHPQASDADIRSISPQSPPDSPTLAEKTHEVVSVAAETNTQETKPAVLLSAQDTLSSEESHELGGEAATTAPMMDDAAPAALVLNVKAEMTAISVEVVPAAVINLPESKPVADVPEPNSLLFSPDTSPSPPLVATESTGNKQALLAELSKVKFRYQDLQKSFRDCNVTLKDLKKDIVLLPPAHDMTSVIRTAIDRLDDYNEDARVELEIRIADEERILTGYETLLSVVGALDEEDLDERKLQADICAFVDGSDRAVARATTTFARKLDDIQHDIACVKHALHELAADGDDDAPPQPSTPSKHGAGWSSWTAGFLGSGSRPVSPAPSFGAVMTSPRARQASFSRHSKTSSDESNDPFASLGLRIPMPVHVMPAPALPKSGMFLSSMAMGTPLRPGPKPRASSTSLFSLGLGARGSTFSFAAPGQSKSPSTPSALIKEEVKKVDLEKEGSEEEGPNNSDIE